MWYSNVSGVPGGGVLYNVTFFNESNATGTVFVHAFWKRSGFNNCSQYFYFHVWNVTGTTGLLGALASLKTDTGISDTAISIIALFFTTVMTVFVSRYTMAGGGIAALTTIFFFTFITGWFNIYLGLILSVGAVAWAYFAYTRSQ